MLLTKEVGVKLNSRNIKHYENLGYDIPRVFHKKSNSFKVKHGTEIKVNVKDLTDGSHVKIDVKCDNCDKELKSIAWKDYNKHVKESDKYYCKSCASKLYGTASQKRLTEFEIRKLINDNLSINFKITNIKVIKKQTHVDLIDIEGYLYSNISISSIRNGNILRFHKSNLYTIENIKLWINKNNKPFKLISRKYEGSDKKLKFKCLKEKCGEIFKMNWDCILQEYGCPFCNQSKGEKKCRDLLILKNFIEINQNHYNRLLNKNKYTYFIPQKEFDGLVGLGKGLLSYDFYLPKYNLLIEYQGRQHERYIPGFHKSKNDFEKQLEHDRRKKEYAQKHNIKLLEIW